jgi:hypothetical protein
MSALPRSVYRLTARTVPASRSAPVGVALRQVAHGDDDVLGRLMERAYAGTIDEDLGDNSDGAVEIAQWRASGAVAEASFVAVDTDDRPVAASLIARRPNDTLWVGYLFTDPDWTARGLAGAALAASLQAIADDIEVFAGVTDGNTPSERLLAGHGFDRIGEA